MYDIASGLDRKVKVLPRENANIFGSPMKQAPYCFTELIRPCIGRSWTVIGIEENETKYPTLLVLDPNLCPESVRFPKKMKD